MSRLEHARAGKVDGHSSIQRHSMSFGCLDLLTWRLSFCFGAAQHKLAAKRGHSPRHAHAPTIVVLRGLWHERHTAAVLELLPVV